MVASGGIPGSRATCCREALARRFGMKNFVGASAETEQERSAPRFPVRATAPAFNGRTNVDKDRIKGSAKQAAGAVKETAGKALGDKKMQAEGKADKAEGKAQNAFGSAKDTLRGK